jgi:hypothetical protein
MMIDTGKSEKLITKEIGRRGIERKGPDVHILRKQTAPLRPLLCCFPRARQALRDSKVV